jgi:hypothetical protein
MNDHAMIARAAFVNMPAQCRRTTQRQLCQSALHLRHGRRAMLTHKVSRIVFQEVGDSQLLLLFLLLLLLSGWSLSGIAQPGSCRTGSQSIGLGVEPRCVRRTCR